MIIIPDLREYDPANIPQSLRAHMQELIDQCAERGLLDLTFVLVVQAGDTEEAIIDAIGWSPLVHPIDGVRFGEPGFEPYCAWLEKKPGWFLLIHTVGNDGFAYVLFVEAHGIGALQSMCFDHSNG